MLKQKVVNSEMKSRVLLLILSAGFLPVTIFSQQLSFKSYTSVQGLSQNSGYCIEQDGLGYIWMGTQDGLNKFNGRQIITYYKETVTRGTLCNSSIKSLYYDRANNWLWIGTENGLCIYNIYADSFYNASHYFPETPELNELMIRSVTGINSKETAVVTFYDGLFICNNKLKTVKQYFQRIETKDSTTAAVVWSNKLIAAVAGNLYEIKDGKAEAVTTGANLGDVRKLIVWQNELWVASSNNGLFRVTPAPVMKAIAFDCGSKEIGPLATDNDNNLWIGTRNHGIVVVSPQQYKTVCSYESATNQDEWPPKFTLSLFKDRQGTIWVGSSGGGFAACDKDIRPFGLIRKREQQSGKAAHNMILCMYNTGDHSIFLGTQLEGIRKYDLATGQTESYTNTQVPGGNSIYGMAAVSASDIWLATAGGMHHFDAGTKKFTRYTDRNYSASLGGQSIYKLKHNDSLLYSSAGGTVFFDLRNKQFRPFINGGQQPDPEKLVIYKTVQDEKDNLWMGCLDKGLLMYNPGSHSIKVIDTVLRFSKSVYNIYNDKGTLWLGTGNGLLVYNTSENKIIKWLTVNNGLPGNVIYSIEKDREGSFWCSSNVGLIKVNPLTFEILHVTASAGLQSGEFNTSSSLRDTSGNLYFGGINGVSFFNPSEFSVSQFSPTPVIESFRVFNKEFSLKNNLAYAKTIQLEHSQNFITLEFGVANYINNEGCSYRYQLTGADEEWVMAGNRTYANYTNLKPGKYSFILQSANSSGIWSKETRQLDIIISPAWWQTWWLRLILLLVAVAAIVLLLRRRISNVREKLEIKQRITETEMAALKAQMNPHFMFNCINSIDAFIQSNDKYNATLYLNKFARLIRNVLDSSKQNIVSFSKDAETLKLYIELEQLRSENKFTTQLDIDKELMNSDCKVPPLIIQPFVENAIIHGLRNREGNSGFLGIRISKTDHHIVYSITDNGIGRHASHIINTGKEKSYGIQMSFDRIKLFNKEDEPSVIIKDIYENGKAAGTNVTVNLKMI